jgi:hypothetical protein
MAPLSTAFIEIRPDKDSLRIIKHESERAFNEAGKAAGDAFGDSYTKTATGRVRDSKGRFVSDSKDAGKDSGKVFGKEFSDTAKRITDAPSKRIGKEAGSGFGKSFSGGLRISMGAVTGILASIGGFQIFQGFIEEAREAAKTSRITAAAIKATGGVANVTADDVDKLTSSLGRKIGVDDDVLASSANLLLTFKGVRNEAGEGNLIFNKATAAIADMAAAMNNGEITQRGLKSSTLQLGKALNDPIKGITALTRVGVTFTDQQKKQIEQMVKSGDKLGAQKIILKEIASEFGGAAKASADPTQRLKVIWDDFGETVGGFVLPLLALVASVITSRVLPTIQGLFRSFQTGQVTSSGFVGLLQQIAAAAGVVAPIVAGAFRNIMGVAGGFLSWLGGSSTAAAIFRGALLGLVSVIVVARAVTAAWAAIQFVLNIALSANPIGLIVLAIGAFIGAIIFAYRNSETFRNVVQRVWQGIWTVIKFAWVNIIQPIFKFLVFYIRTIIIPQMKFLWSIIKIVWKGIWFQIQAAWFIIKVIFALIAFQVRLIWKAFQFLWNISKPIWLAIGRWIGNIWSQHIKPAFDKLKAGVSAVRQAFGTGVEGIKNLWNKLIGYTKKPVQFVVNTVYMGGIRKVWEGVRGLVPGLPALPSVKFAQGGIFPGYTPGRDVWTMPMAAFSGGESIMRPEFTRAVGSGFVRTGNDLARKGGPMAVRAWLSGGQAFVDGGILGRIKGILNRPLDLARHAGSAILEQGASLFSKRILDPILKHIPGADSTWAKAIFSLPQKMVSGFLAFIKKTIDPVLSGGDRWGVVRAAKKFIGVGDDRGVDNNNRFTRGWGWPSGTPWCALFVSQAIKDANAQRHYRGWPTAAARGYNSMRNVGSGQGQPGDLATYNRDGHINIIEKAAGKGYWTIGGNQNALVQRSIRGGQYRILRPNARGGIATDVWRRVFGYEWQHNWGGEHDRNNPLAQVYSRMPATAGAQLGKDIVKGYVFDSGGILGPGEIGINLSKKPETILNNDQLAELIRRRGGDGPAVEFSGDIHIGDGVDLDRLMKRAEFEARASGFGGV